MTSVVNSLNPDILITFINHAALSISILLTPVNLAVTSLSCYTGFSRYDQLLDLTSKNVKGFYHAFSKGKR